MSGSGCILTMVDGRGTHQFFFICKQPTMLHCTWALLPFTLLTNLTWSYFRLRMVTKLNGLEDDDVKMEQPNSNIPQPNPTASKGKAAETSNPDSDDSKGELNSRATRLVLLPRAYRRPVTYMTALSSICDLDSFT